MVKKLDVLLNNPAPSPPAASSLSETDSLVKNCYDGIQELVGRDYVRPSDVHDLDRNMRVYADG